MEFSGSGLRFEDGECCSKGDTLLLEWQLPPFDRTWRGLTQVVRVELISADQRAWDSGAPTHQVAVQFLNLTPEAAAALLRFTEYLQKVVKWHGR
jgi:hypothetical protein